MTIESTPSTAAEKSPAPSPAVSELRARARKRPRAPEIKITEPTPHNLVAGPPDGLDVAEWTKSFLNALGTTSCDLAGKLLSQIISAIGGGKALDQQSYNAILAAMHGIAPRDEAEAMLASQMVATQYVALELLRQMSATQHRHHFEGAGNLAIKVLRTYTMQMETLKRYRTGGEQRVTVQHVTVTAEQAAVQINGPGGGQKIAEQPTRSDNG